jgi:dUTP pyrophosphatase
MSKTKFQTVSIKLKRLSPDARLPERAYDHAAAWDVFAVSKRIVETPEYGYIEYGIGFAAEIPIDYCMMLYPRSSVSDTGLILANSVGLVDPDYRGEIKFRYKYIKGTKMYEVGDKIGQIRLERTIPVEWVEVAELESTNRGDGGFGSSGK